MKEIRVWFNHWFSTAYHLINLIREDQNHSYYFVGTNESRESVIKLVCNEFSTEPSFDTPEEYVNYCLKFCDEHDIDVFVPYREMLTICRHSGRFAEQAVKLLLCENVALMETLDDKGAAYKYFKHFMPCHVPPYQVVESLEAFIDAYENLKGQFNRICFKFVQDKGAKSFRVIDERMDDYSSLSIGVGNKISYQAAVELLKTAEVWKPMMVMPYLEGKSISIDCLLTPSGLISIPRHKVKGRVAEIRFDDEAVQLCNSFSEYSNMSMPYNYQVRYHNGNPYLLEINTRMSGGIQQSCLATGINIPNIAMNQLLGIDVPWTCEPLRKRVTHIEMPVLLSHPSHDQAASRRNSAASGAISS
jgi:hypothetical protein